MAGDPIDTDGLRSLFPIVLRRAGPRQHSERLLIPQDDPSALFTTAGMQPLVPYLLGQQPPAGRLLASCQMRPDNRHRRGRRPRTPDLLRDAGNWSLSAYYKQESINWSQGFLTGDDHGYDYMITTLDVTAGGRMSQAEPPTLYQWAGGTEAFERLTQTFYRHVHQDPLLAPLFARVGPDHAHHVAQWLAEVFGGPPAYTDEHGGYPTMLRHHLGLAITEQQRARWARLIAEAADEAGLPSDPEFRSALVAYIEWASRIGKANSQPGATPPPRAPVPRWGWGEAPPFVDDP